jgi:hypothetical protein
LEFCAGSVVAEECQLALRAAEVEINMTCVREAKVHVINNYVMRLKKQQTFVEPTERECTCVTFARHSKMLAAFDQYERRYFVRRNRALRKLGKAQAAEERARAAERAQAAETVGPPRPKQRWRNDPFVQNVVSLRPGRS